MVIITFALCFAPLFTRTRIFFSFVFDFSHNSYCVFYDDGYSNNNDKRQQQRHSQEYSDVPIRYWNNRGLHICTYTNVFTLQHIYAIICSLFVIMISCTQFATRTFVFVPFLCRIYYFLHCLGRCVTKRTDGKRYRRRFTVLLFESCLEIYQSIWFMFWNRLS